MKNPKKPPPPRRGVPLLAQKKKRPRKSKKNSPTLLAKQKKKNPKKKSFSKKKKAKKLSWLANFFSWLQRISIFISPSQTYESKIPALMQFWWWLVLFMCVWALGFTTYHIIDYPCLPRRLVLKTFFFLGYRFFSCILHSLFFSKKTHLNKKTAKKWTWLANNLYWRIFWFFEKITLKKKKRPSKKNRQQRDTPGPGGFGEKPLYGMKL